MIKLGVLKTWQANGLNKIVIERESLSGMNPAGGANRGN
tara:strand:+ start:812 stop:928 length:117 start_codon:yes stop_codon:yes gene_type:complete